MTLDDQGKGHPVLSGMTPFTTTGKLYKNPKIAPDATILLRAKTTEYAEPEIEVADRIVCSLSAGSQQGRKQYHRPQRSEYDQDHQRQDLSTAFVLEDRNNA